MIGVDRIDCLMLVVVVVVGIGRVVMRRPDCGGSNPLFQLFHVQLNLFISEAHPSTPVSSPLRRKPCSCLFGQGDADSFTGAQLMGQWTRCRRCLRFLDYSYCSAAGYCFPDYPVCPVQSAPPILPL